MILKCSEINIYTRRLEKIIYNQIIQKISENDVKTQINQLIKNVVTELYDIQKNMLYNINRYEKILTYPDELTILSFIKKLITSNSVISLSNDIDFKQLLQNSHGFINFMNDMYDDIDKINNLKKCITNVITYSNHYTQKTKNQLKDIISYMNHIISHMFINITVKLDRELNEKDV